MKKVILLFVILVLASSMVSAQSMTDPAVMVEDQVSTDGTVTVAQVNSAGQGFIVIHADNEGAPGPVLGFTPVFTGANYNVVVEIDTTGATSTLYAMLHEDTGEVGVYEFGTVEGADGPVAVDGAVVTPPFAVELVAAPDQFLVDNTITISTVSMSQPGFVVVHAGDAESFGAVLGFTAVEAGISTDVTVALEGDITDIVWPMLHVDTGEAGVYEFGTVEGADGPVAINGAVATMPVWTVPNMRVADQIVTGGDGMEMMGNTVVAASVLSDGPGFVVIHADNEGAPGPVLGFASVEDGLNTDVVIELTEAATPVLFPMLHVDTGEVGTYEFGTVEGADGPVVINENVLTFPIDAAPSIVYEGTLDGNMLTVEQALIDATGWLVIHADNGEGAPGPVLGQVQIYPGVNSGLTIELAEDGITETLFPMLHYDTGEVAVYEFGTVEGADGPVRVGEAVVTDPLTPAMAE